MRRLMYKADLPEGNANFAQCGPFLGLVGDPCQFFTARVEVLWFWFLVTEQ